MVMKPVRLLPAREKCPDIEIIARAHYDDEVDYITERGANHVVMGEREIAATMLGMLPKPLPQEQQPIAS